MTSSTKGAGWDVAGEGRLITAFLLLERITPTAKLQRVTSLVSKKRGVDGCGIGCKFGLLAGRQ